MGRGRDPQPEPVGVQFPLVEAASGRWVRSTTATGKAVFAAAAGELDRDLAAAIASERDWRKGYLGHVRRLVETEAVAADASEVPRAGLGVVYDRFEFVRDGEALPVGRAIDEVAPSVKLGTVEIAGQGERGGLAVPYRGGVLEGKALERQLDAWVAAGTVEPSLAVAVRRVLANPEWLDLSDTTVVVLGAGAEMGPLGALCRWGARVAPVDLPVPTLWGRALATIRSGAGTGVVPVREPLPDGADDTLIARVAGADLTAELPELAAWLDQLEGPIVLGNYVYAVGADNVRVAVAADALTAHLLDRVDDVIVAGLLTPTDVYAVPEEVVRESQERFEAAGRGVWVARGVSAGRSFAPNYLATLDASGGRRVGIADCLVAQQGPNYALAKRLQQWRFRLARESGARVSANVAPSTSTRSVTRNRVLAAAYTGAPRFDVEVFEPATSNTLMAVLLVHDLRQPHAAGSPATRLDHHLDLFAEAAAHGGLWRQPYAPRSVLPLAAVLGARAAFGRRPR